MSIIGFTGQYREERYPYFENKSANKKAIKRFFDCMQTPNIQEKITSLPKNTLINASLGEKDGKEAVKLMYVPYGEGEHDRFEKLSGKKGIDSISVTTRAYKTSEIKPKICKQQIEAFLDGLLSVYNKGKKQ